MYTEADRRYKRSPAGKAADARRFAKYTPEHREQCRIRERQWRKANPEKTKEHNKWSKIKMAYGLTKDQWQSAFRSQGMCCAACGTSEPGNSRGWVTDHSHATGAFRGILCLHCNVALGMCKDDPHRLRRLAKYVEEKEVSHASV